MTLMSNRLPHNLIADAVESDTVESDYAIVQILKDLDTTTYPTIAHLIRQAAESDTAESDYAVVTALASIV